MKSLSTLFYFFISILILSSCTDDNSLSGPGKLDTLTIPHSMKGYELYSWPQGNNWKYAFLIGTNRTKSLFEVTSQPNAAVLRVTGVDSVKLVLNKFPKDEYVSLIGQSWLQRTWAGQDYGTLQLPPQSAITAISEYSAMKKLNFSVTE